MDFVSPPGTPKNPGNASTAAGRAAPAAPEIAARLAEIASAQAPLGTPDGAGRRIAMPGGRGGDPG